jgi:hypothetical protein
MGAKKILMLVGDFVEDYEVMVPFQALQRPMLTGTWSLRPLGRPIRSGLPSSSKCSGRRLNISSV